MLFLILAILSFFILKPFLLALFLGAFLAYLTYPIYKIIFKRVKNKNVAAILICLLVLILILVPGIFFMKAIVQESYSLYILGKQRMTTGLFKGCENEFCLSIKEFSMNPEISYQLQQGLKTATNWVVDKGSIFLLSVPRILLSLFVIFFTMFYFLKDGNSFVLKLNEFLGLKHKKYVAILSRLKEIMHGLVYGYLIVAVIQGALGALGFFIFGIPSPLFWGVVMTLLALIPFLGTGFVWAPAAVILFLNGIFQDSNMLIFKGIALFVYGLVLISSIDNVLKPKLMGEKAKIHPAVILLGIFGGLLLFGPFGVLIGPLILSLTSVFIEIYVLKKKVSD